MGATFFPPANLEEAKELEAQWQADDRRRVMYEAEQKELNDPRNVWPYMAPTCWRTGKLKASCDCSRCVWDRG